MLKLQKNSYFLIACCIGLISLIMACDQGSGGTSAGCQATKEILITMPSAEEGTAEIDKYEIEVIDAVSLESMQEFEGLPGESKVTTIIDTGAPVTIKATAVDVEGNTVAEAESTNLIGLDRDGLFCDFTISAADGLGITMDCHIIEGMQKMVKFVRDNFNKIVQVTTYVFKDTVEDMKKIIEIWGGEADDGSQ